MDYQQIALSLIQSILFRIAYDRRGTVLELAKKHKTIRYTLAIILFPIGFAVIIYFAYQFHKHPDFMIWTEDRPKQKKLDEYF